MRRRSIHYATQSVGQPTLFVGVGSLELKVLYVFFFERKNKKKKGKKRIKVIHGFRQTDKATSVGRPTAHMSDMFNHPGPPLFFKFWIAAGGNSNFERKIVSKLRNHTMPSSSEGVKSGEPTIAEPTKWSRDTPMVVSHFTNTFVTKKTNYHETKQ